MADALADLYMRDYNSLRVAHNVGFVCAHFPDSLFLREFEKKFAEADWIYDRERFHKKAMDCFRQSFSIEASTGKALTDKTNKYPQILHQRHAQPALSAVC